MAEEGGQATGKSLLNRASGSILLGGQDTEKKKLRLRLKLCVCFKK